MWIISCSDTYTRIRELFTSQLALAEVNRVFHFCNNDANSIYSEPVHKLDAGDLDSACSEPMMLYNKSFHMGPGEPSTAPNLRPTELGNKLESIVSNVSGAPLTVSVHSNLQDVLGAPSNLQDLEYPFVIDHLPAPSRDAFFLNQDIQEELAKIIPHAPIVAEPYDSGHDSTPRTSKHSGFSRRAESGYHSISVTVHDESEMSSLKSTTISQGQSKRDKRLLCLWLRNPFNCTGKSTDNEGEISDF